MNRKDIGCAAAMTWHNAEKHCSSLWKWKIFDSIL